MNTTTETEEQLLNAIARIRRAWLTPSDASEPSDHPKAAQAGKDTNHQPHCHPAPPTSAPPSPEPVDPWWDPVTCDEWRTTHG